MFIFIDKNITQKFNSIIVARVVILVGKNKNILSSLKTTIRYNYNNYKKRKRANESSKTQWQNRRA